MVTAVVTALMALISYIFSCVLSYLARLILVYMFQIVDASVIAALAVEQTFYNVVKLGYFNLNSLYKAIYIFAIALLIMFFIKKMIETYFAWSNGDPETSPFKVVIGFIEALIIMFTFGFIYEQFVAIIVTLYNSLVNAAFSSGASAISTWLTNESYDSFLAVLSITNIVGLVLYIIIGILGIIIVYQNVGRGIEILILRLGIPFACIGLLNADGGVFKGYIQKFIKSAFTVIIQCMLLKLSIILMTNMYIAQALVTAMMAYRTPNLLNDLLASHGNGYYGANGASRVARTAGTVALFKKG